MRKCLKCSALHVVSVVESVKGYHSNEINRTVILFRKDFNLLKMKSKILSSLSSSILYNSKIPGLYSALLFLSTRHSRCCPFVVKNSSEVIFNNGVAVQWIQFPELNEITDNYLQAQVWLFANALTTKVIGRWCCSSNWTVHSVLPVFANLQEKHSSSLMS